MDIHIHLKIIGVLLLALAFAHVFFSRMFDWKSELSRHSLLNRQIFIVHCLFIVMILVMQGVLLLTCGTLLTSPHPLAAILTFAIAVFWLTRLVVQLFVYDSRIWRGDRTRTAAHVFFVTMWIYFSAVHAGIVARHLDWILAA